MEIKTFSALAEENKRLAAIQCIKLLKQKNFEDIKSEGNGLYSHTNSRGVKRFILPCITFREYQTEQKNKPGAKFLKCLGYYVLYWNE